MPDCEHDWRIISQHESPYYFPLVVIVICAKCQSVGKTEVKTLEKNDATLSR